MMNIGLLSAVAAALAQAPAENAEVGVVAAPGNGHPAPLINGAPASAEEFSMTGGMLVSGRLTVYGLEFDGKLLVCSSTLIAPDVVLLAAHCADPKSIELAFGASDIQDLQFAWSRETDLSAYQVDALLDPPDWPADVVLARDAVAHPDYDVYQVGLQLAENFDIALVFLEEAVLDVPFAVLPTVDEDAQLEVGTSVDVVGWGQQTGYWEPPPGTLGHKTWGTSFINEIAPYELQVGAVKEDVRKCYGDGGGPSFAYVQTDSAVDMRIVGVSSHPWDNTGCADKGGVDTRVAHYREWLDQEMTKRCDEGTRVWCEWPGVIPPPDAEGLFPWEIETGDTGDTGDTGATGDTADVGDTAAPIGMGDPAEGAGVEESKRGCSNAPSPIGALPVLFVAGLLSARRRRGRG